MTRDEFITLIALHRGFPLLFLKEETTTRLVGATLLEQKDEVER